ncbi:polysaccharide pyruvyl transferase family protein [soil metagenome]
MNRRKSLAQLGLLSAGLLHSNLLFGLPARLLAKSKNILLVSGWQDVNIGDIAHTPGLLKVLQTHAPDATIVLWKKSKGEEVQKLLNQNFPKVKIIYGNVDSQKNVQDPEVLQAFKEADLMIHGSGPSVVGQPNLEAWVRHTGKPFGIFGTTIQHINPELKALLEKALFIYTRETASIEALKKAGLTGSHISFAPDATFSLSLRNDQKANQFLKENGLEERKFICAVPRLRITPYYKFSPNTNWSEERIRQVEELNQEKKEKDHAKLREAMIAWVRTTKNKVLVCPEMTYQVDIMDELLIDPLPADVKPFVIKRGYWLPDEAASVYAKAHSVLSFECHSPIIAADNGTPFFYLRQPEDTIKGQMYYDLGFNDWIFEIEQTEGKQIADRLQKIWENYPAAKAYLAKNMKKVDKIYAEACKVIKKVA